MTAMPWWPPREVRRRQEDAEAKTEPVLEEISVLADQLEDLTRRLRRAAEDRPRRDR